MNSNRTHAFYHPLLTYPLHYDRTHAFYHPLLTYPLHYAYFPSPLLYMILQKNKRSRSPDLNFRYATRRPVSQLTVIRYHVESWVLGTLIKGCKSMSNGNICLL